MATATNPLSALLRVEDGFRLSDLDPRDTPGFSGDKAAGKAALADRADEMSQWQERLWAASRAGERASMLLVLQGMDTSGKGGIMRHVVGQVDPQGVQHNAFKAPTPEERSHDFLWRIRRRLPGPGHLGVFDRSHYEDVLIVRVHDLVDRSVWQRRYAAINRFERTVTGRGCTIVKVMLHISAEEQKARLAARLADRTKHWKYNPQDVDERRFWADYQQAYQVALTRCSTEGAPWFVVPADRKWYTRWAVQGLLIEHLRGIDPQWPPGDFDVAVEQARLSAS
jgi:PPK2 family polyphosphate:nucleotide phosphotransferase